MPIRQAYKDKQATTDLVAALVLMAWATLRATRNVDHKVLVDEWQSIKDKMPPVDP